MKKNALFTKTETDQAKNKFERIGVSLPAETYKELELFVRDVRDKTGYKISKSELMVQLIKLLPALKVDPELLTSEEDVQTVFNTVRRNIEASS